MQRDVLFLHGWWAGGWIWDHVAGPFASAGYRTHVIDLPGPETGRSGFSDHLQHALNAAREIGNPVLVGHSAGGLLAMKMCEIVHPPACVAITPAAPWGVLPRPSPLLVRFLGAALPSVVLGRDFLPRALLPRIALNLIPAAEREALLSRLHPVSARQVRRILPSLVKVSPNRIGAPLLIVGAAEDRLTPVAQTREIARRYSADYLEYRGAAHFIPAESAWRRMTSDILSWIDHRLASETTGLAEGPHSDGSRSPQARA